MCLQYPLARLVQQLAFENEEEAAAFCRHYSLDVSDNVFSCDRASFVEPAQAFALRRARRLVESKQDRPTREVCSLEMRTGVLLTAVSRI